MTSSSRRYVAGMGWFRKKSKPVPFVEVPRGPRGGLGNRYFVMRGSANNQRAWRKATKRLGLELPDDGSQIPVRLVLRRVANLEGRGRRMQVELGGVAVGFAPTEELRRVHRIYDGLGVEAIEVEALIYRGQSGGWNGRVIV